MSETNPGLIVIQVPPHKSETPEGSHVDPGLGAWGRPELALSLQERGADVVFARSRGGEKYDFHDHTLRVLRLQEISRFSKDDLEINFDVIVAPEIISLKAIGAIRNTTPAVGHDLPELNDPAVRTLARDGNKVAQLFSSLGFERLSEVDRPDPFARLPDIRGENDREKVKLLAANSTGFPKELRAYTFGRNAKGKLLTHYIMRCAGHDKLATGYGGWVYLDQNNIPEVVSIGTERIIDAVENTTNVSEMHVSVGWTSRSAEHESLWTPASFKGHEPQLVYAAQHADVAELQAGLLADQLIRVAQARGTQ